MSESYLWEALTMRPEWSPRDERRRLAPAMTGARFVRVRLNRPDLRVPFSDRCS